MKVILIILSISVFLVACSETSYPKYTQSGFYPEMYKQKPLSVLIMPVINRTNNPVDADYIIGANAIMLSERGYYVLPSSIVHTIIQQDSLECLPDIDPAPCIIFHDRFGADALLFILVKNWQRDFATSGLYEEFEYSLVSSSTGKELWYYDIFVTKNREVPMAEPQEGHDFIAQICCGVFGSLFASAVATALTRYNLTAEQAGKIAIQNLPAGKYNNRFMLDSLDQARINAIWKEQSFGNRMALESHN